MALLGIFSMLVPGSLVAPLLVYLVVIAFLIAIAEWLWERHMRYSRGERAMLGSLTKLSGYQKKILALILIIIIGSSIGYYAVTRPASQIRAASAGVNFDNVVTILMENNGICSILTTCGGSAPFMTSLATTNSIAMHYTAISHPSEPNYIALVGGSTFGISGDGVCCYTINQPNLLDRLDSGVISYSLFAESASGSGTCSFSPPRGADHFGFLEFADNNVASRCSHFLTTSAGSDTEFLNALNGASASNYIWLTPTDNDNCHDTSVAVCDTYLSNLVPKILSSTTFTNKRAALFIVFDEGSGTNPTDYVYAMWAGPVVKKAFSSTNQYSHYSYLHTIESNWNLATLTSNDAGAAVMSEFFTVAGPTPLSASFTFTPTQPTNGSAVTFTGIATGGTSPYAFSWTFGDGGTSTANPASHIYALSGSFTVSLRVTDAVAATFTTSQTVTVTQTSPPVTGNFGTCTPLPQGWSCGNILGLTGTTATITNGVLVTDLFATGVGSDNNPQFASSQKGTFPFSPCQAPATGVLPTNLAVISTAFTPTILPTTDGRYHIYIALYYYLPNGPVTAGGSTYQCLDTQSRVENVNGVFSPVGTTATYNPGDSFGWDNVTLGPVAQGQTYTLTANVVKQCAGDFAGWGISASTVCQLAGVEIGIEGFMFQELKVQFTTVTFTTGVTPPPTLTTTFAFTPIAPTTGQSVTFTASPSGGTPSYTDTWTFGDGTTGTGTMVTHAYSTAATYTVTLTTKDSGSPQQTATASKTITVSTPSPPPTHTTFTMTFQGFDFDGSNPPEADIFVNTRFVIGLPPTSTPANAGIYVAFSVNITGFVVQGNNTILFTHQPWDCSINDNVKNMQVIENGTITIFSDPTIHTFNCTTSPTWTFSVGGAPPLPPPLAASFTFTPTSPAVGQSVTFTATATGGTSPYTFSWNFGDGATSTGTTVTHSYTTGGTFTVTLTTTDAHPTTVTASKTLTVTVPALSATYTFTPTSPRVGQVVTFTGTASGGIGPYTFSWNFNDSTTGTGATVTHTFSAAFDYNVTLTVTDSQPVLVSITHTVSVLPPATFSASFTWSPLRPHHNQLVTFTATISGGVGPYTVTWNFGDGSTGTGTTATHAYALKGTYLVTMTVKDSIGETVTVTMQLTVRP